MNSADCLISLNFSNNLNGLCIEIQQPYLCPPIQNPMAEIANKYCLCDLQGSMVMCNSNMPNLYFPSVFNQNPHCYDPKAPSLMKIEDQTLASSKNEYQLSNLESVSSSKKDSRNSNGTNLKRDMINYKVLEGHKYEIKDNPKMSDCVNKRIYICKYDNCNKVFTKTWNLVSHFRIHTNEKPYKCSECQKLFTQRSNLSRHMAIHCKNSTIETKVHTCTECPRKYSSQYNLNVSIM
jgi:hypothetical protein